VTKDAHSTYHAGSAPAPTPCPTQSKNVHDKGTDHANARHTAPDQLKRLEAPNFEPIHAATTAAGMTTTATANSANGWIGGELTQMRPNTMVSGCAAIENQETRNSACAVRLTSQLEAACRDQADDANHKLAAPQKRASPTRSAMPSFTAHPNQASPES